MSNNKFTTGRSRTVKDVERFGTDGREIEKVEFTVSTAVHTGKVFVHISNGLTMKNYLMSVADWQYLSEQINLTVMDGGSI